MTGSAVRVVKPLDGKTPEGPKVRTSSTGHKLWCDIPEPPRVVPQERYPWREMLIGESFFVAKTEVPGRKTRMSSVDHANKAMRPRRFRSVWSARDPATGEPGYRVWRIA